MTPAFLRQILQLSRPRFWLYLLGPYLIGLASVGFQVPLSTGLWWALYWTLPANALIYLVNDAFDDDTDQFNEKKRGYESRILPKERKTKLFATALLQLPWILSLPMLPTYAQGLLGLFWVLGIGYSTPPVRFKARPFLDSASNILYVLPGFFAFFLTTPASTPFPWLILLASAAWCAAMHAVSAVPDIAADQQAHLSTIATTCGATRTLQLCLFLYLVSGFIGMAATHGLVRVTSFFLTVVYVVMLAGMLRGKDAFVWYKRFPLVNTLTGFFLFWAIVLNAHP